MADYETERTIQSAFHFENYSELLAKRLGIDDEAQKLIIRIYSYGFAEHVAIQLAYGLKPQTSNFWEDVPDIAEDFERRHIMKNARLP